MSEAPVCQCRRALLFGGRGTPGLGLRATR